MAENPSDSTLALVRDIVRALDDKKADRLRVLHVTAQSTITDYLVIATGTSEPHLRALRIEIERVLDTAKAPIAGMDRTDAQSGWTVVDAYQLMVHVFTPEKRDTYRLEQLWNDAEEIPVATLLAAPPTAAAAPEVAVPAAPKAKAPVRKAAKKAAKKTVAKKAVKSAVAKKTAKKAAKKVVKKAAKTAAKKTVKKAVKKVVKKAAKKTVAAKKTRAPKKLLIEGAEPLAEG